MRRTVATYEACQPEAVAAGSQAQMSHFVFDAQHDIALLADVLDECREALSYAMRGTSDAEQSNKYATTISRIAAALEVK